MDKIVDYGLTVSIKSAEMANAFNSTYQATQPFATGEIVHVDNEWRLGTEEFKGDIVIEVKSSGENIPRNIKFNAYFIGYTKPIK